MDPVLIAPGLTLTDVLYETAAVGAAAYAADLAPLTWEQFISPMSWWLVPDGSGRLSKAELTLAEGRDRTVKFNVWYAPDLRGPGGVPCPHSHPWPFESKILLGGYTEDRYVLDGGQVRAETGRKHVQGTANPVGRDLYHEVVELHTAPGATMTLMLCGQGERGTWGHLDPATGSVTPPQRDPFFPERLRALNPHR
ncbi:hypothetical protein K7472_20830 [Streptomyces sp. PTM05]|uniref:Uncharacterized protein n=1 Tax=Streptantibioticus parmotrematis TaxID=2873249 RepID=A0ABS7QZR4_9ACTN|nr:hypothetical protein [Streptantibioticus parmotrematis]MBY8887267.1 hypothetical protein [Streptantibioticus parmotrematis]